MSTLVNVFIPTRRFDPDILEMMDQQNVDSNMLRDDLKNLRTINRYFGGLSSIRQTITPMLMKCDSDETIRVLDLATGSGDHPITLAQYARKLGKRIHITAVDKNPFMLQITEERTREVPEIRTERCDIRAPDYPDQSFDIVLCSLTLHHFSQHDAIRILRQMNRLSRIGFIVNDLNRTRLGAWTAWLWTHVSTRNPMTRYDSYLSVLRAFTPSELDALAHEAGITNYSIMRRPFFRLILSCEKNAY